MTSHPETDKKSGTRTPRRYVLHSDRILAAQAWNESEISQKASEPSNASEVLLEDANETFELDGNMSDWPLA